MTWKVEVTRRAEKQIAALDAVARRRVLTLLQRVAGSPDPRSVGDGLVGGLAGLWRYRVGDYRVICRIDDQVLTVTAQVLTVTAIEVGHRREVYR